MIRTTLLRAALGLEGPAVPTNDDFMTWLEVARTERVLPLLYNLVRSQSVDLDDSLVTTLTDVQLEVMGVAVRLEHALLSAAKVFAKGQVSFAVLKGAATAHLDYPDASLRQFGDVDILVDPAHFAQSLEALRSTGWREPYALPRNHQQFTHAVTLRSPSLAELDVHQRVAHRALGLLVAPEELMERRQVFEICGVAFWALSDVDRLVHALIHSHSSRGEYQRLSSFADVLVMAAQPSTDVSAVIERAESWRVRPIVEDALRQAFRKADVTLPTSWKIALNTPVRHRDRVVERAYLSEQRRPILEELAHLRLMKGTRDRWRYVRGYFTTDDYYAQRTGRSGLKAQVRYLLSKLRPVRADSSIRPQKRAPGLLARVGLLVRVNTTESVCALTFDDGPDERFTNRVLDTLAGHGARATFFLDGPAASRHPQLVQRIVSEGHELAAHGWSHKSAELSEMRRLRAQVRDIRRAKGAIGRKVRLYRPPYGHESRWTRVAAAFHNVQLVYWSASTEDWRVTAVDALAKKIQAAMQPGAIVLMHDRLRTAVDPAAFDRSYMIDALDAALSANNGRVQPVTVTELCSTGKPVVRRRRHTHAPLAAMTEQPV